MGCLAPAAWGHTQLDASFKCFQISPNILIRPLTWQVPVKKLISYFERLLSVKKHDFKMLWLLQKSHFSIWLSFTSNAKFSGSLGGALSPRKLLHNRSASRFVIIPHRRDEIGIAPARRKISSWNHFCNLAQVNFRDHKVLFIKFW